VFSLSFSRRGSVFADLTKIREINLLRERIKLAFQKGINYI